VLEQLRELEENEETVIVVGEEAFIVKRASNDDIERIGKGYFYLD
jgi:hypothetical protein